MASYFDQNGSIQQVDIPVSIYREARDANMSVASFLNQAHPTKEGDAPAFQQMCASLGLFVKNDPKTGIRATKLKDVINGTGPCSAAVTTRNDVPQSRILYQAAILSTIEDKLANDLNTAAAAFDRLVAVTETIEGTEFKRAILNYDKPESARSQQVAQLARPVNMLTLTTSDSSLAIPTVALGIQWSDQAMDNVGLDIIALSVARQVAVQRDASAQANILAILNGDEDVKMAALADVSGAYVNATTLDSTATAHKLTQTAWIKWLYAGHKYRHIDWVVTDIDGALAIQNRSGAPTVQGDDNLSPRIDTKMKVANPLIPDTVNVFVTDNEDWPADTILGIDSRFGIQRVNSISANYQATETDVIARSNTMRWDSGTAAMRLFDQAFTVLQLQ